MPPHPHHHHHHHGGGGGHYYHGGGGWVAPYAPTAYVVTTDPDPDWVARTMALIMKLPKKDRAAAYLRAFGKAPAPGMLDGIGSIDTFRRHPLLAAFGLALTGFLAYKVLK